MSSFAFTFTVPSAGSANDPPKTPPRKHQSMFSDFVLYETPGAFPRNNPATPANRDLVDLNYLYGSPLNGFPSKRKYSDSDDESELDLEPPSKRACVSLAEWEDEVARSLDDQHDPQGLQDVGHQDIDETTLKDVNNANPEDFVHTSWSDIMEDQSEGIEDTTSEVSDANVNDDSDESSTDDDQSTQTRVETQTNNVHPSTSSGDEVSSAYDPMNRPFPQSMQTLCRYFSERVSARALFARDLVNGHYHCRATHKRDGNRWVVIPQCTAIATSDDNYQRHIKQKHLGGFKREKKGKKKSGFLSVFEWMKKEFDVEYKLCKPDINIKVRHWPAGEDIPMIDDKDEEDGTDGESGEE